jgi:integrase
MMGGLGSLYKQRGSRFWWYKLSVGDAVIRKSTKEVSRRKAEAALRTMLERIGAGKFVPTENDVTFEEIARGYLTDYEVNGRRSLIDARRNVRVLSAFFGRYRALEVRRAHIQEFVRDRTGAGLQLSTINRELAALRRMFSLAIEHEVLSRGPKIKLFKEDNVRRNFLTVGDFEAIHAHLPTYLQDALRWLYLSGGRKNEMVSLQWRDVGENEVTIRAENTKTHRSRTIPLVGELHEIIERARAVRRLDCPFVFHRHGKTVGDFRKAWHRARMAAGYPGTWIHDFRRSAARNLVRTPSVSIHTAMQITGHVTPAMFRRYDIQDMADVRDVLERTQERIEKMTEPAKVRPIR